MNLHGGGFTLKLKQPEKQTDTDFLNEGISVLGFTANILAALRNEKVYTVGKALTLPPERWAYIRSHYHGIGQASIDDAYRILSEHRK